MNNIMCGWTQKEKEIIYNTLHMKVKYVKDLLPMKTLSQIYSKRYEMINGKSLPDKEKDKYKNAKNNLKLEYQLISLKRIQEKINQEIQSIQEKLNNESR